MKVMLTGGTVFLGSCVLSELLRENHEVIVLKRSFSDTSRVKKQILYPNITLIDIDKVDLATVFKENKIEGIIHVATEYGRSNGAVASVLEANLVFPIKLIELAIKNNVEFFINTDSYFNKENLFYSHLINYSLSKKSFLSWLKRFSNEIRIINIVLEHIYGPYDGKEKFVEKIIQEVAVKKVPHMAFTHGHQKRDFIFAEDVAKAYSAILKSIKSNNSFYKVYEVGTGKSIQVREMATAIKDLSNSPTILGFGEIEYRSDEIMDSKADCADLNLLRWTPQFSLTDGIANILNSYGINRK